MLLRNSIRFAACAAILALGLTGVTSAGATSQRMWTSLGSNTMSRSNAGGVPAATLNSGGQTVSFSGSNVVVPPMPPLSAPQSTWQTWVTAWNASLDPQGIATSFEESGCDVSDVEITPMSVTSAEALGYPVGIIPDGGFIVMNCSRATEVRSMTSPGIGYSEGVVGGAGIQQVESCEVNNAENVCTTYEYDQYGEPVSITGHVELSTDGYNAMTCSVGGLIQNSSTVTLYYQQLVEAFDPTTPNGDNVWNGNFWKGTANPYHNEGNICALI